MNISTTSLADLGRFIASRTANTEAAKIAHSSAPQLRYDAVVSDLLRDPQQRAEFTAEEQRALVQRISDAQKRQRASENF